MLCKTLNSTHQYPSDWQDYREYTTKNREPFEFYVAELGTLEYIQSLHYVFMTLYISDYLLL
jgi:hypothetical protein